MSGNDANKGIQDFREAPQRGSRKRKHSTSTIDTGKRIKKVRLSPGGKARKDLFVLYRNLNFGSNEHSSCSSLVSRRMSPTGWQMDRNRSGVIKGRSRMKTSGASKRSKNPAKCATARSNTCKPASPGSSKSAAIKAAGAVTAAVAYDYNRAECSCVRRLCTLLDRKISKVFSLPNAMADGNTSIQAVPRRYERRTANSRQSAKSPKIKRTGIPRK